MNIRKRIIISFLFMVLISPCIVFCLDDDLSEKEYISGDIVNLYTIKECEGPLKIKIQSKYNISDGLQIEKCKKVNDMFIANCYNNFPIRVKTFSNISNEYDFIIEYYLNYINIESDMSNATKYKIGIINDGYRINKMFYNYKFIPEKTKNDMFDLNIEIQNIILFFVLILIFVIGIFFYFLNKKFSDSKYKSKDYDVMNYKPKKDISDDDFFKKIK